MHRAYYQLLGSMVNHLFNNVVSAVEVTWQRTTMVGSLRDLSYRLLTLAGHLHEGLRKITRKYGLGGTPNIVNPSAKCWVHSPPLPLSPRWRIFLFLRNFLPLQAAGENSSQESLCRWRLNAQNARILLSIWYGIDRTGKTSSNSSSTVLWVYSLAEESVYYAVAC
jgi:hypothetical protein